MNSTTDWNAWPDKYDKPGSLLAERLHVVQDQIEKWLDATAPQPVSVMSSCAGDGRDLLQVLERRKDASRVTATLLEADPRNADKATQHVARLALTNIEVRCIDAGISDAYAEAVPADLVLLCGIFGNISDEDVHRTIASASQFCNGGGQLIWTRHRQEPDLTPKIRAWFGDHGFAEERFVAPEHSIYSVGVHRFHGDPSPLKAGQRLFTFVQ